jgi:hypothetical protein
MSSGQTEQLSAVSAQGCVSCAALVKRVEDVYAKGGRLETDGWVVEAAAQSPTYVQERPSFLLRVKEERRKLFNENGQLVDTQQTSKFPMRAEMVFRRGAWLMASLEIIR